MTGGRIRSGLGRSATIIAVSVALAAGFAAADFGIFVRSLATSEQAPSERADAVVALTGGAERIGDAARLLTEGFGRRLLITGVNARTTAEEIAKREPGLKPLLDCCVDLDRRAMNTVGNASETAAWARRNAVGSLVVVTSNWHMPRTLVELRAAAPELRLVPFPVVAASFDPADRHRSLAGFRLLALEYGKFRAAGLRIALGLPARSRLIEE